MRYLCFGVDTGSTFQQKINHLGVSIMTRHDQRSVSQLKERKASFITETIHIFVSLLCFETQSNKISHFGLLVDAAAVFNQDLTNTNFVFLGSEMKGRQTALKHTNSLTPIARRQIENDISSTGKYTSCISVPEHLDAKLYVLEILYKLSSTSIRSVRRYQTTDGLKQMV